MADNNMNINSTPEQELDLDQLEQVSGGGIFIKEKGTKLQPASGGAADDDDGMLQPAAGGTMPASSSDSLKAAGGGLNPKGGSLLHFRGT